MEREGGRRKREDRVKGVDESIERREDYRGCRRVGKVHVLGIFLPPSIRCNAEKVLRSAEFAYT